MLIAHFRIISIKYYRVVIIGCGEIGSRHLQGLSQINLDIEIIVIDPSFRALKLAQNRYEEMNKNYHVRSVRYHQNIQQLEGEFNLAIIATSADVRRRVIENLLNEVQIKYLIFEKVVFQSVLDFEFVINLLDNKKIKSWINCTRRMIPFFRALQNETIQSGPIRVSIDGCNFGLASNAIHMLDLFSFLTDDIDITVDATNLDGKIYQSKRENFIELGGELVAQTSRGDILKIYEEKGDENRLRLCFETEKKNIIINQLEGICIITEKNDVKQYIKQPFSIPYQSDLTATQVTQILNNGTSYLTPLKESYLIHKPMLNAFNMHLSSIFNKIVRVCPIT